MPYYVTCSLMSLQDHTVTIWTNLDGLRRTLTLTSAVTHLLEADRDGEHLCFVATLRDPNLYHPLIQFIGDCLFVENILEEVAIL